MKREIKFRAYRKSTQNTCDVLSIDFENESVLLSDGDDEDISDVDLMQYTGLHDKKGREIYESDILRVERNDDPNDFYIAPVSWCGGDYPAFDILPKYWPHRVNYDTNALSAIYAGWSEEVMTVIGNIYEDPDLLEAEK